MQPRDHDAIVLVHGIGDGEQQGDFLVDVTEPLLRWVGDNGGQFVTRHSESLRRGERPAAIEVTGTLPDPDREGQRRDFHWRFVEARWSDEFRPPPVRMALTWSARAYWESVLDQLAYYDTAWRFWRLLARLPAVGGIFRWWSNGPAPEADGDRHAWAYRYHVRWGLPFKFLYGITLGLLAPLALLALATPLLLTAAPLWVVVRLWAPVERWSTWERAYFNGLYRLLLTCARLPLVVLGFVVLLVLLLLEVSPVGIPGIERARRAINNVVRMRLADAYVYNVELVQSWAIADAVERVIRAEADRCRTLTVLAYSQGAVVAYEALSRLAGYAVPPAGGAMLSVREAMRQIDSPLLRPGLRLRLITVGAALNRALGHALGGDARTRALLRRPLPAGIRWVDVWALHDPVSMGSLQAALCARAGVAPLELAVSNTLTELDAHTTYWKNDVEVLATIAEELAADVPPAAPVATPVAGLHPGDWQRPGRFGFWGWRQRHGRTDRATAARRRGAFLHLLAAVRALGYVAVGVTLFWLAFAGARADRVIARADGVPLVQTPMRWLWMPVAPGEQPAQAIRVNADGSFRVGALEAPQPERGPRVWRLAGAGALLRWDLVRYALFPAVGAAAASLLFLAAFTLLQWIVLAVGRRWWWDPPARMLDAPEPSAGSFA